MEEGYKDSESCVAGCVVHKKNGCMASSLMCITDNLDGSCTGCTCQTLDKRTAS